MSDINTPSPRARRWLPLALLCLLAIAALVVWRSLPPPVTTLAVVNLDDEPVALAFYGAGLREPIAPQSLAPGQRVALALQLQAEGELRVRVTTSRAAVDAQLLPRASQLRETALQLELRDGNRFVLVPSPH